VHHPWLPTLPEYEQREEISRSLEHCQRLVENAAQHLSYPFGAWDERTRRAAASCGIRLAVTTEEARVSQGGDPLLVPRLSVGDWSADELAFRIRNL
jgi:peptidoglycan/xylan/chitin deacetylase (PgdA/CDA1 family)